MLRGRGKTFSEASRVARNRKLPEGIGRDTRDYRVTPRQKTARSNRRGHARGNGLKHRVCLKKIEIEEEPTPVTRSWGAVDRLIRIKEEKAEKRVVTPP